MSIPCQWWTRWFDEQHARCNVSRADKAWEAVRAALGTTPATTALIAEIILVHERQPVVQTTGGGAGCGPRRAELRGFRRSAVS